LEEIQDFINEQLKGSQLIDYVTDDRKMVQIQSIPDISKYSPYEYRYSLFRNFVFGKADAILSYLPEYYRSEDKYRTNIAIVMGVLILIIAFIVLQQLCKRAYALFDLVWNRRRRQAMQERMSILNSMTPH
jgi:hypothetical protein